MTKIVEISGKRIRLYSRPPLWLLALFGAIFLALLFGLCPSHALKCQRTEPRMADLRVKRQLFGFTLSERTIPGVTAAEVQESWKSSRRRTPGSIHSRGVTSEHNDTSRIVFATQSGPVPLTKSLLAGRDGFQNAADQLNQFLAATNPATGHIDVPTSRWILIPTLFVGLVTVGLIHGGSCRCVVDRIENVVRITWPTFLGSRREEIPLTDVESFALIHQLEPVRRRESERDPQGFREFLFAIKNFKRLHEASFENSIGIRLYNGDEISITRQSRQSLNSRTQDIISQLEQLRRGEL